MVTLAAMTGQLVAEGAQPLSISLLAVLSLGFFLGMRHATDADHVVAVSTIVSRERRIGSAALIGGLWGVGPTITILAVGAGIILFTLVIPPRLGLSMELSVGVMLIVLGLANLRGFWSQGVVKGHTHGEPGEEHTHEGAEASVDFMDRRFGGWKLYQIVRPLIVGLVHGLAGSAAVALLVLTTLHNSRWAVAYLFIFGVGTIAGMMVITMVMASALRYAGDRSAWINRRLAMATGILSVAFGMFIVYQMGFAHGLFTAHPTWTPE
jgi:high-affinity nickel permease